jgi:sarcosine oxidase / L-pipecolate oxidase
MSSNTHVFFLIDYQGWVNAAQATFRTASAAQKMGVRFHSGAQGEVSSLIYTSGGTKVIGIKTKSGTIFHADKVVTCAGAWTNSLIDTKGQLIPRGHSIAHIQLTPEEHARYADMPIFDDTNANVYFFPPFEEHGIMKVACLGAAYCDQVPRIQSEHPKDGIPRQAEEHLRRGMKESIPALADKDLFDTRVCWCTSTADEHFLITPHPEVSDLYLATGGIFHPKLAEGTN